MVSLPSAVPLAGSVVKSIPKSSRDSTAHRPTLSRKRASAALEPDLLVSPLSPSKRAKVSFSDEVEVQIVDEWGTAPDLVEAEVRRALQSHLRHDDFDYESLRTAYLPVPEGGAEVTPAKLRSYTAALSAQAATLTRSCSELVQAMLSSDWAIRDETYVVLYRRFLNSLVSAHVAWLSDVLRSLLAWFVKNPKDVSIPSEQDSVSIAQARRRVHATIQSLFKLVPSASTRLINELHSLYPSPAESKRRHVLYIKNALRMIEYLPELQSEILGMITAQLLKVDVEVQINLEDLSEDATDGVVHSISLGTSLDSESDIEEDSESEQLPTEEEMDLDQDARRAREIIANVEKLDVSLDLLFQYYHSLFPSLPSREIAFETMISHFLTLVLPSYRSRHIQFLMFHFAQQTPELVDQFTGALVTTVLDKSKPSMVRESAAAYLASFVARGIHVPGETVAYVFKYIGDQLAHFRSIYTPNCRGPDPRRYRTYYALTQALLYIFCFRWRDLTTDTPAHSTPTSPPSITSSPYEPESFTPPTFQRNVRSALQDNIFSILNPLKVCAPNIVAEFARIAHHLHFLYVYTLLEANRRVRLPLPTSALSQRESALSGRLDDDAQRLDEYFPFDPYRLPRSKRWVEHDYREWQGVPGLDEDGPGALHSDQEEGSDDAASLLTATEGDDDD